MKLRNVVSAIIITLMLIPIIISIYTLLTNNSILGLDKDVLNRILSIYQIIIMIVSLFFPVYTRILELIHNNKRNKRELFVSYSKKDKNIQNHITIVLDKELKELSKIKYSIITDSDSINLQNGTIDSPDSYIMIISENYVKDSDCIRECNRIIKSNKKYYPIVIDSYRELNKLPEDISNTKSAFIKKNEEPKEFSEEISNVAKEIVESENSDLISVAI